MANHERIDEVGVVLVRPRYPANIGAAARAMSVMGLSRLMLVQPADLLHPDIPRLARHGMPIVENAQVFDSLRQALSGCRRAVAFSARVRSPSSPVIDLRDGVEDLTHAAFPLALVFGPESSGLTSADILLCTDQWVIPTLGQQSSLNLAQAVQIACYELIRGIQPAQSQHTEALATVDALQVCLSHLNDVIRASGFSVGDPKRIERRLQSILTRAQLTDVDANVLSGLMRRIAQRLQ